MGILNVTEKLMTMDDTSWKRHSNPLSVYSRFSILPLLTLAISLRFLLDWWTILVIFLVLFWTWLNPRLFPEPKTTKNWASMGTFGERIYLNRDGKSLIPKHHLTMVRTIVALQIIGIPFWCFSLYTMKYDTIILSTLWLMFTKMWFVDRMVWVYQDVKALNPVYESWLK